MGKPQYIDKIRRIIKFLPDGLYAWDKEYFAANQSGTLL